MYSTSMTAKVPQAQVTPVPILQLNSSGTELPVQNGEVWPEDVALEEDFSEAFQRAVTVLGHLYTLFIPLLIILGLVGNGLSFVTFLFTRLKVRASSFYLGTLALSDFGYLFIMAFLWLDKQGVKQFHTERSFLRHIGEQMLNKRGLCQGILYFSSAFSFWSVWLTVTFTAERCLAVQCPLWRLQLGTRSRARATVAATATASFLLNAYLLLLTDVVVYEDGTSACNHRPEFERILHYTNIVDTVVTLIVPFLLIVIMNFMIGRALYLFNARRKLQRVNSVQMNSSFEPDNRYASNCTPSGSNKVVATLVTTSRITLPKNQPSPGMHPSQISVNRMLFLVCTVFIILNLPSYVVRINVFVLSIRNQPVPDYVLLLQRYFMLLYYTNFAVNFLLYTLGSRTFRRMMRQYLWTKWRFLISMCHTTDALESRADVPSFKVVHGPSPGPHHIVPKT